MRKPDRQSCINYLSCQIAKGGIIRKETTNGGEWETVVIGAWTDEAADHWSETMANFNDSFLNQTLAYGEVRWGRRRLEHLYVFHSGFVAAAAQVMLMKIPLLNAGVAYVSCGPMWRRKETSADTEVFGAVIQALIREYVRKRNLVLRIRPQWWGGTISQLQDILRSTGFCVPSSSPQYRTLLLDLSPPLGQLRRQLDQKWRNQLNRAEKNNLCIVQGVGIDLFKRYAALHQDLKIRKGYVGSADLREYELIQQKLPSWCKLRIMLAIQESQDVAGVVISSLGDTGVYLLGATHSRGLASKGSYLLQWQAIADLKSAGHRWYDLGGINPEKNPGVYHFKRGLTTIEIAYPTHYEYAPTWWKAILVRFCEVAKRHW